MHDTRHIRRAEVVFFRKKQPRFIKLEHLYKLSISFDEIFFKDYSRDVNMRYILRGLYEHT